MQSSHRKGYSGNELLEHFKKAQSKVRPAVEAVLVEAERVAALESEFASYGDVFGGEDKENDRGTISSASSKVHKKDER